MDKEKHVLRKRKLKEKSIYIYKYKRHNKFLIQPGMKGGKTFTF